MKILAQVFTKGELNFGTSDNGDWERQTLVVKTMADNPKLIPIEFFGKKKVRDLQNLYNGDYVEVIFEIDGREYEDRWYPSINGISCRQFQKVDVLPSNNE